MRQNKMDKLSFLQHKLSEIGGVKRFFAEIMQKKTADPMAKRDPPP